MRKELDEILVIEVYFGSSVFVRILNELLFYFFLGRVFLQHFLRLQKPFQVLQILDDQIPCLFLFVINVLLYKQRSVGWAVDIIGQNDTILTIEMKLGPSSTFNVERV